MLSQRGTAKRAAGIFIQTSALNSRTVDITALTRNNIFAIPAGDFWDIKEDRVYIIYSPLNGRITLAAPESVRKLEQCAAGGGGEEAEKNVLSAFQAKGSVPVHRLPASPHDLYQIDILANYTCNFKCIYCYSAAGRSNQEVEFDKIKAVADYLFRSGKQQSSPYIINFSGGGEPLMSFGLIRRTVEYIKEIINHGYAYVSNGSVYFDVPKYSRDFHYGKLSGRNVEELLSATRQLDGQQEKRNPADFALWKKASPEHIMHWPSPWSEGFPGWHLECSTMGQKYLGETFDIHGGGMDLVFPHHECEIAQSVAHSGHDAVRYWMHNNMITINGQKMGKSLGNFITLDEFFTGSRKDMLSQAYSPMTIRFFILQAHYGGTVDFSNEALQAAEKAYERMLDGWKRLNELKPSETSTVDVADLDRKCHEAMNDDLNTPVVIAHLFDACRAINQVNDGKASISETDLQQLKATFKTFLFDILGIYDERESGSVNLKLK